MAEGQQAIERRRFANSVVLPRAFRISWGAVFAGVVMGIAVQVLLNSLGMGIGASVLSGAPNSDAAQGVGIGAAIWLFLSTIAAYYFSGWIAARMAGLPAKADGVLHGLLTWGFSTVLMLFLITSSVGAAFSGIGRLFGGAVQATAQSGVVDEFVNPANTGGGDLGAQNSGATGMSDQAGGTQELGGVGRAVSKARSALQNPQTQQNLQNAGQNAAQGAAATGFTGFLLLLIAGAAAAIGGRFGARTPYLAATALP